jgi:hypothetical protein
MAWTEDERRRHEKLTADLERLSGRAEAFTECLHLMREYVKRNPPRTQEDADLIRLLAMAMGALRADPEPTSDVGLA